jgi:Uncharacterized protein conserved in bacteria
MENLTPGRAAAAVFVGVFIANVPIYGFQSLAAIGLATILGLNGPLTLAATFVNNPLLQPILVVGAVEIGHLVLKGRFIALNPREVMAAGPGENLRTWVIGSLLLGMLLGGIGAMATFIILRRRAAIRTDIIHRRKEMVNALFASCNFYERGFVRWKLRLDRVFEFLATAELGQGPVVDLGCGHGITLAFIAVENPQRLLDGCDLSARRIETARTALAGHNPSLSVADVRDWKFADAGLILIMDVLQYLDPKDQLALLQRCSAGLVPGGRLIFRVHDMQSGLPFGFALLLDRLVFLAGGVRRNPTVLPASSYREMLERTGLGVREQHFRNRLPLAHILFIAEKPETQGVGV